MLRKGYLRTLPLIDLLYKLRQEVTSGRLFVFCDMVYGIIRLEQGQPVAAQIISSQAGLVTDAQDDALLRMLSWEDGMFIFRPDIEAVQALCADCASDCLVMARIRQYSNPAHALENQVITLDTPIQLSSRPLRLRCLGKLTAQHWELIRTVTAQTVFTVCDLAHAMRLNDITILRLVVEMIVVDVLEIVTPAPPYHQRPADITGDGRIGQTITHNGRRLRGRTGHCGQYSERCADGYSGYS